MTVEGNRLGAWDYVIMVLVLVISACIGIYYRFTGGKQKTVQVNIFAIFYCFLFSPDPTIRHTWFTLIIGGSVTFLSLYGVNQTQVQRYMTMSSLKSAQKSLWLQLPVLSLMSLSTSFAGLTIYARYYKCDPVASGAIDMNDQLMPYFVVDTMGHLSGLTGLFIAGLFSAALSTVSATINSLAAVTIEDYYKPLYKKIYKRDVAESKVSIYSKVIALCYGFVCVATAFVAQNLGGVLQAALTIFGIIGGPLLGLFSLGMFTTRANQKVVL
ncbi:sodium-coupled monocarboxylate transporter [Holotrichia oblita]|uniref:Sodium-coupled monocarboxylate transporter n=1 Tax=Holotrichia oblita TaxID=644536 RepID=A0ACB9TFB3_HOLOL|nr:sodium-coupled monocarboxylate transporter [Holotrichia oblita]